MLEEMCKFTMILASGALIFIFCRLFIGPKKATDDLATLEKLRYK